MRILITGYHGFVGQNLIPYLKDKGDTIYGLGREGDYTWSDLEKGNLPEVDAIVHLAGKAHDTKNQTEAQVYFDVNYGLTAKVFDYFAAHPSIKTFIFFSSVKAAADKVIGDKLTEDVKPTPKGPYGESKIKAEEYITAHSDAAQGRKVFILRPCMMHGPGNKGNLNLLYKVLRTGMPWPLGAFENRRSFCSIKNVCYVVGRLLAEDIPEGIYNLADDEAMSTNELVSLICSVLGKKAHIIRFGRGAMTALAHIGDHLHLPLNTERLSKLTENYIVSNDKIKAALHIKQMPTTTRDGLAYTISNFNK